MGYSAWPTAAEVTVALGSVTKPSYIDLDDEVASAVAELERATGYKPFLAEGTDDDQRFSNYIASGVQVQFPTGYVTLEEFYVDATEDDNGTLLVEGTDYILSPGNGELPIEGVTMLYKCRFTPYALRVVGKRGYSTDIPADVWNAVLQKAALPCFQKAANAAGGTSVTSIKQGPVTIEYGDSGDVSDGYSGLCGEIQAQWNAMIGRYMRVSF